MILNGCLGDWIGFGSTSRATEFNMSSTFLVGPAKIITNQLYTSVLALCAFLESLYTTYGDRGTPEAFRTFLHFGG